VKPVRIDVQSDESIKSAFNEVMGILVPSGLGGINLLVNNSGILEKVTPLFSLPTQLPHYE
jgi:NAD(P)-dependent dehydrogenase (short-subunit alcohol dehydrogenase family)